MCSENVVNKDDYKTHLIIKHGVEYDESKILNPLKESIKPIQSKESKEIITRDNQMPTTNIFDAAVKQILDVAEGRSKPIVLDNKVKEIPDEIRMRN